MTLHALSYVMEGEAGEAGGIERETGPRYDCDVVCDGSGGQSKTMQSVCDAVCATSMVDGGAMRGEQALGDPRTTPLARGGCGLVLGEGRGSESETAACSCSGGDVDGYGVARRRVEEERYWSCVVQSRSVKSLAFPWYGQHVHVVGFLTTSTAHVRPTCDEDDDGCLSSDSANAVYYGRQQVCCRREPSLSGGRSQDARQRRRRLRRDGKYCMVR